jgi:hypothetical protein
MTNITRTIGRLAAVGAVALTLMGTAAAPAGAKMDEDDWNDSCFAHGGQPFTIYDESGSGWDEYACDWGKGDIDSFVPGPEG